MIKKYGQFFNESDTPEEFDDINDYNEESDENTEYITTGLPESAEEEEEEGDFYKEKLEELGDLLGVEATNGQIKYEGKTIIFPSETNKYHIDRKEFETAEEAANYLRKK